MQVIKTDVLVIGGGGAAARAALEARLAGAQVILATKGYFGAIGTRGSGATAGGSSAVSVFATPGWTGTLSEIEKRIKYMAAPDPEQAYANIIQAGLGMADPALVKVLIEDAPATRSRLLSWGATFQEPGMRSHGVPIMAALSNEIRRSGVIVLDNTMIATLLTRDGTCLGAIGVDERNSERVMIRAGSTIIGTGGDAGLFRHNLNPSGNTGDGYILGFEAGAELMNLEFKQIFLGTIFPTKNMLTQALPLHTRLLNGQNKEFLSHYLPEGVSLEKCLAQRNGHNPFSTRDEYSRYVDFAILAEVMAGRGTEHEGFLLDRSDARIPRLADNVNDFWLYRGIDFSRPVEAGVCHHCSLGGLKIDINARTCVENLYAAGEAAAGPHGADRMGGHMLLASQVFGARAGKNAAAAALKTGTSDIYSGTENNLEGFLSSLNTGRGKHIPREAVVALRRSAYFNLLVIRSAESLNRFMEDVKHLKEEAIPDVSVNTPGELIEALELRNLLKLAEIEAGICLLRTESRGPHFRQDFPSQDDKKWLRNIIVSKAGNKMQFKTPVVDPSYQDRGDKGIGYWG
jgi:fumarate reductase (CoM/CoB) subunit A